VPQPTPCTAAAASRGPSRRRPSPQSRTRYAPSKDSVPCALLEPARHNASCVPLAPVPAQARRASRPRTPPVLRPPTRSPMTATLATRRASARRSAGRCCDGFLRARRPGLPGRLRGSGALLRSWRGSPRDGPRPGGIVHLTAKRAAGRTGLSQAASGRALRRLEEASLIISDGDGNAWRASAASSPGLRRWGPCRTSRSCCRSPPSWNNSA
jgi:hypothetical protein